MAQLRWAGSRLVGRVAAGGQASRIRTRAGAWFYRATEVTDLHAIGIRTRAGAWFYRCSSVPREDLLEVIGPGVEDAAGDILLPVRQGRGHTATDQPAFCRAVPAPGAGHQCRLHLVGVTVDGGGAFNRIGEALGALHQGDMRLETTGFGIVAGVGDTGLERHAPASICLLAGRDPWQENPAGPGFVPAHPRRALPRAWLRGCRARRRRGPGGPIGAGWQSLHPQA
uniref:Uncharacterized protein n=1 Tax=uncultured Rhodobacterales bacterium HF4000_03E16 TaxID=710785 RepID=E0XV95_9RHOB|nr:hypothetical protein [uncultured Rhodobacterales bacterium HF4000_03E16]